MSLFVCMWASNLINNIGTFKAYINWRDCVACVWMPTLELLGTHGFANLLFKVASTYNSQAQKYTKIAVRPSEERRKKAPSFQRSFVSSFSNRIIANKWHSEYISTARLYYGYSFVLIECNAHMSNQYQPILKSTLLYKSMHIFFIYKYI